MVTWIRPPGIPCQPESGLLTQTSYSIFEFVFADLGIVFFDTEADLLQWQKHVQLSNVSMILNARLFCIISSARFCIFDFFTFFIAYNGIRALRCSKIAAVPVYGFFISCKQFCHFAYIADICCHNVHRFHYPCPPRYAICTRNAMCCLSLPDAHLDRVVSLRFWLRKGLLWMWGPLWCPFSVTSHFSSVISRPA